MKVKDLSKYVSQAEFGKTGDKALTYLNGFILQKQAENGPESEVSIADYLDYLHTYRVPENELKQLLGEDPQSPHSLKLQNIFTAWQNSDALQKKIAALHPYSQASEQIKSLRGFIDEQYRKGKNDFSLKAYKSFLHKNTRMKLHELNEFLTPDLSSLTPDISSTPTPVEVAGFFQAWETEETTDFYKQLAAWEQNALTRLETWKTVHCNYDASLLRIHENSDIATMTKRLKLLTKAMTKNEAAAFSAEKYPEIALLTALIAYQKAKKTIHDYAVMQARYPDCTIESITTKRHETARLGHKMLGLNRDTGLTTLHHSWMTPQKRTDFLLTQQINGLFIDALSETDTIPSKQVRVLSSSVSRALETAAHATLPAQNVSQVDVSGDFAELKLGILPRRALSFSADPRGEPRGRMHATEIFQQAPGFTNTIVNMPEGAFVGNGFNLKRQEIRVTSAAQQLLAPPPSLSPRLTVTYLVAHGGIIRHMLQKIKGSFSKDPSKGFSCSIPPGSLPHGNLQYGDSYELLIARRIDGSIADVNYNGKHSRFGEDRLAYIMTGEEFRNKTRVWNSSRPKEIKEIDRRLDALSDIAKGKKRKSTSASSSTLFQPKQESQKEQYDAKVRELLNLVKPLVKTDRQLIRQAGLQDLQEQLQMYVNKSTPPPATPRLSSEAEVKHEDRRLEF